MEVNNPSIENPRKVPLALAGAVPATAQSILAEEIFIVKTNVELVVDGRSSTVCVCVFVSVTVAMIFTVMAAAGIITVEVVDTVSITSVMIVLSWVDIGRDVDVNVIVADETTVVVLGARGSFSVE
jgi:hypothetical protein